MAREQLVFYVRDFERRLIHFYLDGEEASNMASNLGQPRDHKTIIWYGTAWYKAKWNENGTVSHKIAGRKKDLGSLTGWEVRKQVIIPYNEFIENDDLDQEEEDSEREVTHRTPF